MAVFRVITFALTMFSYGLVQAKYNHNNEVIIDTDEDIIGDNVSIIGGNQINIQEAPYMAALAGHYYGLEAIGAGTIIHEKFILTSASVIKDVNNTLQVLVGADRLFAGGQLIKVANRLCHQEFCTKPDKDICLLKLAEPIQFGRNVNKIILPEEDSEFECGTLLNVTGWGKMQEITRPDKLRRTKVKLQNSDFCPEYNHNLTMTDNTICAGLQGRGPCVGDAGAPLTLHDMQIGVSTSFVASKNPSGPSVFTKVSKFVYWIDKTMSKNKN